MDVASVRRDDARAVTVEVGDHDGDGILSDREDESLFGLAIDGSKLDPNVSFGICADDIGHPIAIDGQECAAVILYTPAHDTAKWEAFGAYFGGSAGIRVPRAGPSRREWSLLSVGPRTDDRVATEGPEGVR